jgi:hypothetical protein
MPMLALRDVLGSATSATATSMLPTSSPGPVRELCAPPPLPPPLMAAGADERESWLDSCDPSPLCCWRSPKLSSMASDRSDAAANPAVDGDVSAPAAVCDSQRGVSSLAATAMPPVAVDSLPELLPAGEQPKPTGLGKLDATDAARSASRQPSACAAMMIRSRPSMPHICSSMCAWEPIAYGLSRSAAGGGRDVSPNAGRSNASTRHWH